MIGVGRLVRRHVRESQRPPQAIGDRVLYACTLAQHRPGQLPLPEPGQGLADALERPFFSRLLVGVYPRLLRTFSGSPR